VLLQRSGVELSAVGRGGDAGRGFCHCRGAFPFGHPLDSLE
jgi:hypothetical protein